ncbi:unnamed protein product [Prunus armeniaca]|uniref:Uncharacterized protein n=1 Tax=Prunus armeniaca TaxID=36596 RepID=A0A6J5UGZ0_PRUAR|nr:unnamed protein product [Prunus armeniaca]
MVSRSLFEHLIRNVLCHKNLQIPRHNDEPRLVLWAIREMPYCHENNLEFTGYYCECATCIYRSKYPPRKGGPIKYPISIMKQLNPHFNPDFDPPYVEDQGFIARFWSNFFQLHVHDPRVTST